MILMIWCFPSFARPERFFLDAETLGTSCRSDAALAFDTRPVSADLVLPVLPLPLRPLSVSYFDICLEKDRNTKTILS